MCPNGADGHDHELSYCTCSLLVQPNLRHRLRSFFLFTAPIICGGSVASRVGGWGGAGRVAQCGSALHRRPSGGLLAHNHKPVLSRRRVPASYSQPLAAPSPELCSSPPATPTQHASRGSKTLPAPPANAPAPPHVPPVASRVPRLQWLPLLRRLRRRA